MSDDLYTFIARWGGRREDARSCGARLAVMLRELAKVHCAFARWCEQGEKPAEWNQPFCAMPPQLDELASQFARNKERPILGRECGYRVSAWNGLSDDPYGMSFRISAGDGYQWQNPFSNSVSIEPPYRSAENADLISAVGLRATLLAVVAGWEPDCAELNPVAFYQLPPGEHLPPFRTGWLSYLGPRYAPHVVPPPQAIAEQVPGGGLLMLATEEPFDMANPVHMRAAEAIQLALEPIQSMIPPADT